jgi:hypothetical protein
VIKAAIIGFMLALAVIASVNLLIAVHKLDKKRDARKLKGVMFSPYTGGAYADTREVIESEMARIRADEV